MKYGVRQPGGGRKKCETIDPKLVGKAESVISNHVAGCPIKGVKWTYLSIVELQTLLKRDQKTEISWPVIKRIVKSLGYGCRSLAKKEELKNDVAYRDEQFKNIAKFKRYYLSRGYVVLSVDTKKKELLGRFYRPGKCLSQSERTCFDHDFPSFSEGKVVPHGIYDVGRNEGHITLCGSKDTAEFNVDCCRQYWDRVGRHHYPKGTPILLLLDGGGSNGCKNRLFKQELQDWADEAELNIRVAHYPAYCSKYNPIEHRLFPSVTKFWNGMMLDSMETMKEMIVSRSTLLKSDLSITVDILDRVYETGVKVYDNFLDYCNIQFDDFLPDRNYRILAMPKSDSY